MVISRIFNSEIFVSSHGLSIVLDIILIEGQALKISNLKKSGINETFGQENALTSELKRSYRVQHQGHSGILGIKAFECDGKTQNKQNECRL